MCQGCVFQCVTTQKGNNHMHEEGELEVGVCQTWKNPRDFEIDEQGIYFKNLQNHLQMFQLFRIFYLKQRLGTTKSRATSIVCADCPQRR